MCTSDNQEDLVFFEGAVYFRYALPTDRCVHDAIDVVPQFTDYWYELAEEFEDELHSMGY